MNSPVAEHEPVQPTKVAGRRFTYASGTRPLAGYTIKRGVGHGGFGEVYYAVSDAGKETALKLIRRNLEVEIRGVTQCLNLKHPNLLTLYDIRQDEHGDSWVVMEYVAGESLEDVIARHPNGMPVDEVLRWFHGIAAGCGYLHDHGIVHRDLKPGNIFLDEGIVKIGDYGLAKFISCSRRSGQTESVGTVHYMAPEIANGRYGKEVDLYALGIILYEMLTGHVPFDGESVGEVLMKHLTAEPRLDRVAEPYRTAISRALTKDPDRRVHSAADITAHLPPANGGFSAPPRPRPVAASGIDDGFSQLKPVGPPALPSRAAVAARSPYNPPPLPGQRAQYQNPYQEPIARTLYNGWINLHGWWSSNELQGVPRVLVTVAAVIGLLFTIHLWVPLLLFLSVLYGLYWVVREIALGPGGNRTLNKINSRMDEYGWNWHGPQQHASHVAADAPPHALFDTAPGPAAAHHAVSGDTPTDPPPALSRRERLMRRRQKAVSLGEKSIRQKLTELTGAMLLSPLVVLAAGLLVILVGRVPLPGSTYLWLTFVGTLGAWTVLIPAKCWEGKNGEPILRRFTMMLLGLGLGVVAYGLKQWFFVDAQLSSNRNLFSQISSGHNVGSFDELAAYAVYFGFLMLVPAWWWQADASRPGRLNIFSTAWVAAWAFILSQFWPFPHMVGVMIAAMVSIAVQMASPRDQKSKSLEVA
jgi:serine/threonine protein kinase